MKIHQHKHLCIFSVTARTLQACFLPNSDLQRGPNSKFAKAASLKQQFLSQLKCSILGHVALLSGVDFS